MKQPFTSVYAHNRKRSSTFATINNEDSMTQQDDAHETDINVIMKKYGGQGGNYPTVVGTPLSGDFTQVGGYREMVERIKAADDAFQEIPAKMRERFNNDPEKFMEFIRDKDNLPEMRKLGLALPEKEPTPEPAPIKVVVTNPEPPKP